MDSFTDNITGVADLIESSTNKVSGSGNLEEGATGEKIDALDLPMTDEELLKLRDEWENKYAPYEGKINKIFKRNLKSYLGSNPNGAILEDAQPGPANLQFEAEETFLPAALARNPDPIVLADNTPEGNKVADTVKTMLQFHATLFLLKRKLEVMVRRWSIYQLAVLKHGWDSEVNDIQTENRKVQNFIFDPEGYVDVYGDFIGHLGERIYVSAEKLIDLFPKHKEYISLQVMGEHGPKLGTQVCYTEWWNDDYCFVTFKEKVLDKHKNEFFNYEEKTEEMDMLGQPVQSKPRNHFASPKKPYTFLSVYSLQERPHDITGLIEQNIPNQAKITKRVEQIDINVSKSNNGELYSENNFNQETAKQAANAIRNPDSGQVLVPPGGPINEAVVRLPAPSFPDAGFKDLENSENHLRSSWGIQGIASQQQEPDETARGMILNQGRDTSRIGGGISNVIEQSVASSVYNWWVQLYIKFYEEKHFASIVGVGKATEYVQLAGQDIDRQLVVSVAPNSMKPVDDTAKANQATTAFGNGSIGPKTYLEAIDFPNADEAASDGALYKMSMETDGGRTYIQLNFPELWQSIQGMLQQQAQEQQMAQQQQLQQEAQSGQQKIQQSAQAGEQQISQKEQAHSQQMRHGEEAHQAKIKQATEAASAKLSQVKLPK